MNTERIPKIAPLRMNGLRSPIDPAKQYETVGDRDGRWRSVPGMIHVGLKLFVEIPEAVLIVLVNENGFHRAEWYTPHGHRLGYDGNYTLDLCEEPVLPSPANSLP